MVKPIKLVGMLLQKKVYLFGSEKLHTVNAAIFDNLQKTGVEFFGWFMYIFQL